MSNTRKVYDLSKQNQMADNRRMLIADSKKEYDVSFVPALVNRKYYKRWIELQTEVMTGYTDFIAIQKKLQSATPITDEETAKMREFITITEEASDVGSDIVTVTIKANGYEFEEDDLLTNFSEAGIAKSIDFIMGIEDNTATKKKPKTKNS